MTRRNCLRPRSFRRRTSAGFAFDPLTTGAWVPEINTAISHLRDVLGDPTYESLVRKGETMTTAAMATYAYDQIDQARTELEHPWLNAPQERRRSSAQAPTAGEMSFAETTAREEATAKTCHSPGTPLSA